MPVMRRYGSSVCGNNLALLRKVSSRRGAVEIVLVFVSIGIFISSY